MAIEDNNRYYGLDGDKDLDGSEANYETAENIDAVLRDMTDIYQNAPAADIGKAVVLDEVETEEEQTIRRFKLKEVSKPINAANHAILVGTGPDENWAKGNEASFSCLYTGETENHVPTESTIGAYNPSWPAAFGQLQGATAGQIRPTLKNGYLTRDTAKQKIAGTAQVNIGDDNQSYSTETFWGRAVSGPEVNIGSAAIIEMNSGGYQPGFIPVLSMRGNCVIDMKGKLAPDSYHNWAEHASRTAIKNAVMPFNTNKAAPVFQMHDEAIVSIVEKATLQMKNAAMVEIGGNADVHIYGGEITEKYHEPEDKVKYIGGQTDLYIGPNSHVRMAGGSGTNGVGINLEPTLLYVGTINDNRNIGKNGLNSDLMTYKLFSDTANIYGTEGYGDVRGSCAPSYPGTGWSEIYEVSSFPEINENHVARMTDQSRKLTTRNALGPIIGMEGNVNMHYSTDGGYYAKRFGVTGSYVEDDWVAGGVNVNVEKGFMSGQHVFIFNVNGNHYIEYAPDTTANIAAQINPSGEIGIKFDTKNVFGVDIDTGHVEYINHANKIISFCNGKDHFKQIGGSSHFESWSGNVLLRNRNSIHNSASPNGRPHLLSYSSEASTYGYDDYPDYPLAPNSPKTKRVAGTAKISADLSNMNTSDIGTTYETELKNATKLPNEPANAALQDYNWTSFSNISKNETYRKYTEHLVITHFDMKEVKPWKSDYYFYSDNDYTETTLAQSAEFKTWVAGNTGLSLSSSTLTYASGTISKSSGGTTATYRYYLYYYRINISDTAISLINDSTVENSYVYKKYLNISDYSDSSSGTIYGSSSVGYSVIPGWITSAVGSGTVEFRTSSSPYTQWSWNYYKQYGYAESIGVTGLKLKSNAQSAITVKLSGNIGTLTVEQFFARADVQTWFQNSWSYVVNGKPRPSGATYDSTTTVTRGSYTSGYTSFSVYKYIVTYDDIDLTNELYTTSSSSIPTSTIDYPNTAYADMPESMQSKIQSTVKGYSTLNNNYKEVITTDTVTKNDYSKVKDWLFSVGATSIYQAPAQHRGIDWLDGPVQTKDAMGEFDWENGPVIQAYGPSNFMMRSGYQLPQNTYNFVADTDNEFDTNDQDQAIADFINSTYYTSFLNSIGSSYALAKIYSIHHDYATYSDKHKTYRVYYGRYNTYEVTTTADEFDLTDMNAAIRQFVASSYYADLQAYVTTNFSGQELWYIGSLTKVDSTTYKVNFAPKDISWNPRVESYEDTPVIEVVDGSELRMYGGAYIKGETKYGETTYTFGSTTSDEAPVSFTLAELAALKNMLINPPQSFIPLTQAEYDQLDPPDPDTLYVITDGATAQMLPDASVEEF